jgi:hypothetical protein
MLRVTTERNRAPGSASSAQATTPGSARPLPARRSSETTLVSSRNMPGNRSGGVGSVELGGSGQLAAAGDDELHVVVHGQLVRQGTLLAAEAAVLLDREQHVGRPAAIGDEHGPRLRGPLGTGSVLIELPTPDRDRHLSPPSVHYINSGSVSRFMRRPDRSGSRRAVGGNRPGMRLRYFTTLGELSRDLASMAFAPSQRQAVHRLHLRAVGPERRRKRRTRPAGELRQGLFGKRADRTRFRLCIVPHLWLSDPQTTPKFEWRVPRRTAAQWFFRYPAQHRGVVVRSVGLSEGGSRNRPIKS